MYDYFGWLKRYENQTEDDMVEHVISSFNSSVELGLAEEDDLEKKIATSRAVQHAILAAKSKHRFIISTDLIRDLPKITPSYITSEFPFNDFIVMFSEPILNLIQNEKNYTSGAFGFHFLNNSEKGRSVVGIGSFDVNLNKTDLFSCSNAIWIDAPDPPNTVATGKYFYEINKQVILKILTIINAKNTELVKVDRWTVPRKHKYLGTITKQAPEPFYILKIKVPKPRYNNNGKEHIEHRNYSHAFDVRGHFRHLIAKRYKQKQVIWISPHKKGEGIYIPKTYEFVINEET